MVAEKRVEDDRLLEAKTVNVRISMFATQIRLWREEQAVYCVLRRSFFCHANFCGNSVCNDIYIIVLYSKLIVCNKKFKKKMMECMWLGRRVC
jgi:hypothetical protein